MSERRLPWEDLGVPVRSNEPIKEAGLDFKVCLRKLLTEDRALVKGMSAAVREDTGAILGVVSEHYKIVQNEDAFKFIDTLSTSHGMEYVSAGCLKEGKQVWMTCKLPQQKILDDDLDLYFVLFNNHDGKGSVRICLTPIRVICSNMQNAVLQNNISQFSIYHTVRADERLAEAYTTYNSYISYVGQLNTIAGNLATKKVSESTARMIYDDIYIDGKNLQQTKLRNANDVRDLIMDASLSDDLSNYRGTAWGYIQAALDVSQHRKPIRSSKSYYERLFTTSVFGQNSLSEYIDALKTL